MRRRKIHRWYVDPFDPEGLDTSGDVGVRNAKERDQRMWKAMLAVTRYHERHKEYILQEIERIQQKNRDDRRKDAFRRLKRHVAVNGGRLNLEQILDEFEAFEREKSAKYIEEFGEIGSIAEPLPISVQELPVTKKNDSKITEASKRIDQPREKDNEKHAVAPSPTSPPAVSVLDGFNPFLAAQQPPQSPPPPALGTQTTNQGQPVQEINEKTEQEVDDDEEEEARIDEQRVDEEGEEGKGKEEAVTSLAHRIFREQAASNFVPVKPLPEEEEEDSRNMPEFLDFKEINRIFRDGFLNTRNAFEKNVMLPLESEFDSKNWKPNSWKAKQRYFDMCRSVGLKEKPIQHMKTVCGVLEVYKRINELQKEQLMKQRDTHHQEKMKLKTRIEQLQERLRILDMHKARKDANEKNEQ